MIVRRPLVAYSASLSAVAVAIAARLLFDPWAGSNFPFVTLFAAVCFAAWFGGKGPAIMALVVGAVGVAFFYCQPRGIFALVGIDFQIGLILYLLTGVVSILMFESLRKSMTLAGELRESEERLFGAFAAALDCIVTIDHEGVITEFNAAAERAFGYRREDVIGRELADTIIPLEYRQQHWDGLARYLATGEGRILDKRIELTALRSNGEQFPVELSVTRVKSVDPPVFTAFLRDISARTRAEQALKESEERLRLALDAGRMGVWDWTIRTNELKWSDSLETLHGLQPGTFGGTFDAFNELVHPEDRQALYDAIQKAVEDGSEFDIEFRVIWPNGSLHWIAGRGQAFPGEDGLPLRMIGVGLDVTQRKRSEQTAKFLADASAELAVLVDFESTLQKVATMAVPYFADWVSVDVLEADGVLRRVAVAHVDPSKVELAKELHSRFPPDPSSPKGVWAILRSGQPELVPEITERLLAESTENKELLDIVRQLGLSSYIGVPLKVAGRIIGVLTFITAESGHLYDDLDLTIARDLADRTGIAIENSQLYQELRMADRRKDEFLATLAHELRNPLAPIQNAVDVIKISPEGVVGGQFAEMMDRQVNHIVKLVDDLLEISRITRNKIELQRAYLDVQDILANAVETSRPLIDAQRQELITEFPSEPLTVYGDLVRLNQVVTNLLNNAAKYSEPGTTIYLSARQDGDFVNVAVRDNGLGIAPEVLPRVFDLFVQAENKAKGAQTGLGIGLTLVKRLVEMHGGNVAAKSEGLQKGSEFVVRLPLSRAADIGPAPSQTPEDLKSTGSWRVLVVDDNHDAATVLGAMLKLIGNEVLVAFSGKEALEVFTSQRPEVVFLDIGMPDMTGHEVARLIRDQASDRVILVALTGWGQDEDKRRSKEAGFDHHLVKPVNAATLQQLLGSLPD